jgi:hypothetical protein
MTRVLSLSNLCAGLAELHAGESLAHTFEKCQWWLRR